MFISTPQASGPPFFRVLTTEELGSENAAALARFCREIKQWDYGFLKRFTRLSEFDVERWLAAQTVFEFYHIDWMRGVVLLHRPDDAFAFKMRWC